MSTIVLRSVKGSPLTNTEVDSNFSNLNTDKTQFGGTYSSETANGVLYLSATKVLTSGSALTFDGTNLAVGAGSAVENYIAVNAATYAWQRFRIGGTDRGYIGTPNSFLTGGAGTDFAVSAINNLVFGIGSTEQMRLTSTGLGIGTSSPVAKLDVAKTSSDTISRTNASGVFGDFQSLGAGLLMQQTLSAPYGFALQAANAANSAQFPLLLNPSGGNVGIGTNSPNARLEARQDQAGAITRVIANNFSATAGSGSSFDYYYGATRLAGLTHAFAASGAYLSFDVWSGSAATQRMLLDGSGNLGLGVTPSAWSLTNSSALQIRNAGLMGFSNSAYLTANAYNSAGTWRYIASAVAGQYSLNSGAHEWFTAPSGTAGAAITFTQAMTLDASGNLGVGTTSPTSTYSRNLHINGSASAGVRFTSTSYTDGFDVVLSAGDAYLLNRNSTSLIFGTSGTERARIDSSGNLGLGVTPSAWVASDKAFQVLNGGVWGRGNGLRLTGNVYYDGTNFKYIAADTAAIFAVNYLSTGFSWQLAASGLAGANATMAQVMMLDAAGNLGLGVTPSAWTAGIKAIDIGNGSAIFNPGSSAQTWIYTNAYYDSAAKYKNTAGGASWYQMIEGIHAWHIAPSGTAGAAITFTQAMTLGADGNLAVGTSSTDNARIFSYINSGALPSMSARQDGAGPIQTWQASGAERARIDSSGNLLVGTTSANEASGVGLKLFSSTTVPAYRCVMDTATGGNSGYILYNINATNNGYRFYVQSNGGIANYSANNINLSDERTKKDIENAGSYLAKICAIPVRTFKYKDQTDELLNLGVIAQEVEAVAPELVDVSGFGETPEDGVPLKAIYQTDLQYALMKCIQELKAIVDAQGAEIAALKAAA